MRTTEPGKNVVFDRLMAALGVETQTELAKRVNIPLTTVNKWYNKGVPGKVITEMSSQYRISADWLLHGEGEMHRDGVAS